MPMRAAPKRESGTEIGKRQGAAGQRRARRRHRGTKEGMRPVDRDALVRALEDARNERTILVAMSRLNWCDVHDGAKCPESRIAPPEERLTGARHSPQCPTLGERTGGVPRGPARLARLGGVWGR